MPRYSKEKREQLTDQMRSAIRTSVARLCAETGDVSMERVAQDAGIAKGTIYLYYKTKLELIRDVLNANREIMLARIEEMIKTTDPPEEQLRLYARIMMEEFQKNRHLRTEFIRSSGLPALPRNIRGIEMLNCILQSGIERGVFRPVPVEDTVTFIRASLIGQFRFLLMERKNIDIERAMNVFEDMVLRALKK